MKRFGAVLLCGLVAVAAASAGHADTPLWGDIATISPTSPQVANRLCYSDGLDIACNATAPYLTSGGKLGIGISPTAWLEVSGTISATGLVINGQSITGSANGDRIVSTSANVIAYAGGTISLTTGGTSGTAYFDTTGRLVLPGISATTAQASFTGIYASGNVGIAGSVSANVISVTALQIVSQSTSPVSCNSGNSGTLRYNSPTTTLELCTGSGWIPMGVGVPAGTISAFASTTCPTGWSEYTAARGRFLRGIDNGAGYDPSGTRSPGSYQADLFASHTHRQTGGTGAGGAYSYPPYLINGSGPANSSGADTEAKGGDETRPKNVAVTFCQFNGTSNGWNNPIAGGATTPGGNSNNVQYNGGGAFSGSDNFAWNNSTGVLTVTGTVTATTLYANAASFTTLTVGGVAVTGGGGSGDRIVSTSANVIAYAGGTISLTTGGVSGTAYFDTAGRLVLPGISATTAQASFTGIYASGNVGIAGSVSANVISVTALQIVSQSTSPVSCNSGNSGTLRYNSPTTTLELCTGAGWIPMGVGVPAGTISAFASTTCPTGWSEYTAARGRFMRGIDNGAGNDPDGTRAPGGTQADAYQGHQHNYSVPNAAGGSYTVTGAGGAGAYSTATSGAATDGTNGTPRTASETRPKNVAVTFCQFNGTSNGWNNPIAGGATTPGGNSTNVQYNAGGAFSGSDNFTWNNASALLTITGTVTATNVYASAVSASTAAFGSLTVGGVAVTGGTGDRIVSGSVSAIAQTATNAVQVSGSVNVSGTIAAGGIVVAGNGSCAGNHGSVRINPATGRLQMCLDRP